MNSAIFLEVLENYRKYKSQHKMENIDMRHNKNKRSSSDPINVKPLSEKAFRDKYADRVRHGKTANDKRSKAS